MYYTRFGQSEKPVINYGSRTLFAAKRNYSQVEKSTGYYNRRKQVRKVIHETTFHNLHRPQTSGQIIRYTAGNLSNWCGQNLAMVSLTEQL